MSRWIKSVIRDHLLPNHDFELAWCLLVSGVLRISVEKEDFGPADSRPNSVVFAMLGMLRERGLLSVRLSHWAWRADFKERGVFGQDWLPFYEAVRRKWTTDKDIVSAVSGDPILMKMLASNVTFLEDQIFDAARINITKRVFAKTTKETKEKASSAGDVMKYLEMEYE